MTICPNCAAENRAEAAACYYCGHPLTGEAARPNPTQPVRVRPETQPTQPGGDPAATQPGARAYQPPPPGGYPDPGATQIGAGAYPPGARGYAPSGQTQPYAPGHPAYDPYADPYAGQVPVPPVAAEKIGLERFWPALVGALVIVFLCAGAIVVWTFSALIGGGSTRLGREVATQAAEILPLPAEDTPTPTEDPTPWPTFTALPTFTLPPTQVLPTATQPPTAQPTATPPQLPTATPPAAGGESPPALDPTQSVELEKLLSPECAQALDNLSDVGGQVTSNPAAPFDSKWRAGLNKAVDQVNQNCGEIDEASPLPDIVSEARDELNLATDSFDNATQLFNEGVRDWNLGKILDAGREARQATEHLNNALAALGKLRE